MTKQFKLDSRLVDNGEIIHKLELSQIILVNNKLFPWLILVPQKADVCEIIDLNEIEQKTLFSEIVLASKVVRQIFNPDKLNIAALGNVVAQLHVHVIARYKTDSAWPLPTFNQGNEPYDNADYNKIKLETVKQFNYLK